MVKINLDNFRDSDGSIFVYRPKVYFDNLCFEYAEKTVDEKLEILRKSSLAYLEQALKGIEL